MSDETCIAIRARKLAGKLHSLPTMVDCTLPFTIASYHYHYRWSVATCRKQANFKLCMLSHKLFFLLASAGWSGSGEIMDMASVTINMLMLFQCVKYIFSFGIKRDHHHLPVLILCGVSTA